jgi:enamine deaminase RidA (YjgF/YER057c/UK114 family)
MQRTNFSSGTKWEEAVAYSRAVRVENVIEVSGTVAVDEKQIIIGEGDPYLQTKFILQKIEAVLKEAGAELKDVVRTRMFVTDIKNWEEHGRAHGEVFKDIMPCTTMVEISSLITKGLLIEIEATAIIAN